MRTSAQQTVAITGASGYLGGVIRERLCEPLHGLREEWAVILSEASRRAGSAHRGLSS